MGEIIESDDAAFLSRVIRMIAVDVGKEVAAHIETMYPHAVDATSPNMLRSVEGCCVNQIEAMFKTTDLDEILARLEQRKRHRRERRSAYRKIRERL